MTGEEKRKYMEISIEVMKNSVQESRKDAKPSPFVGAVLVWPDGSYLTAYRGELREGDHAEYTLIERKCRDKKLDECVLFATLEPCAPGARHEPKLGCSERIVNARIKKVYIGIEDPDPSVDRKGLTFLKDHGVDVEMYPRDLQEQIAECNRNFLSAALLRAKEEYEHKEVILSKTEYVESTVDIDDLNQELLSEFLSRLDSSIDVGGDDGMRILSQLGILSISDNVIRPTGIGLLLFGKHPELSYPNARVKATYIDSLGHESIEDFAGPLLRQPQKVLTWVKDKLDKWIDRSNAERLTIYKYPIEVVNELIKNAIVHRDYDIEGAATYVEINNECIVVKSPGVPVYPLTVEQIKSFNAPSLSRNPKLMYVFDVMGLAEQRGLGFDTVKRLNGSDIPLPNVTYVDPYLIITLPLTNKAAMFNGSKAIEVKILDYLKLNPGSKRMAIETYFELETKTCERAIKSLIEKGLVRKEGKTRAIVYYAI